MVKLLAEKYDGIACGENYQDRLLENLDTKEFPNLTYTRDLQDWCLLLDYHFSYIIIKILFCQIWILLIMRISIINEEKQI